MRPSLLSFISCRRSHVLYRRVEKLPPARNFIDEIVFKKLKTVGMPPSDVADDATFLRRVTLDIAGRLPTVEDVPRLPYTRAVIAESTGPARFIGTSSTRPRGG